MKFKPGQECICIDDANWRKVNRLSFLSRVFGAPLTKYAPVVNEVLVVKDITMHEGEQYLSFQKYWRNPRTGKIQGFCSESFEPLITDFELHKELETIEQTV